jgi:hypothetical protein
MSHQVAVVGEQGGCQVAKQIFVFVNLSCSVSYVSHSARALSSKRAFGTLVNGPLSCELRLSADLENQYFKWYDDGSAVLP